MADGAIDRADPATHRPMLDLACAANFVVPLALPPPMNLKVGRVGPQAGIAGTKEVGSVVLNAPRM